MYKLFIYRLDKSCACGIRIVDMKEFSSLGEAINSVSFDDDLFEIAIDTCVGFTRLKTVARPASMRCYFNDYYWRCYNV